MTSPTYKGKEAEYTLVNPHPIEFGRTSVLFVATCSDIREVCIKVFRSAPKSVQEFDRELVAQKSLSHPNILQVIDYGWTKSDNEWTKELKATATPFTVMPFCKGGNLRSIIKTRDYIPFDEAINLIEQIASAVDYAHRKGFIHGDIKPENILFCDDLSIPYLADFSVSKYFPFFEPITGTGTGVFGTTAYLSPEQIAENVTSPLSDIYSFSMVAYEMLTGLVPWDDNLPAYQQMTLKIQGKLIEPIEANHLLTQSVNDALLKGLAKNRRARPHTAIEICQLSKAKIEAVATKTKRVQTFWHSLSLSSKVAIITAIITATSGIIVAIIKIIPVLFGR